MTRRLKKLAHSLYECKYHIVFCPKYRYQILKGDVGKFVEKEIRKLSEQKAGVEILEINIMPDHVHMVVSIPPKYAVSAYIGYLKGRVAIAVFRQFSHLGKRYWGRHFWSRGYCATTVGIDEEQIRKYVKYQQHQDKKRDAIQGRLFD